MEGEKYALTVSVIEVGSDCCFPCCSVLHKQKESIGCTLGQKCTPAPGIFQRSAAANQLVIIIISSIVR